MKARFYSPADGLCAVAADRSCAFALARRVALDRISSL